MFNRDGMWLTPGPGVGRDEGESLEIRTVRYRTVGDMTCTGAVESTAATVTEVIAKSCAPPSSPSAAPPVPMTNSRESAMEDRKKEGYF